MKKKIRICLALFIFLITFFCVNIVNADEPIKIYKLKINLINIETKEYTIELIDGIADRIYEKQDGNEKGEHDFSIATDLDESHLVNYRIRIKFNDGEVKNFDPISIEKLIDVDEDKTDLTYDYVYNVNVKIIPSWVIKVIIAVVIIIVLIIGIISLKKHKKRIK